MKNILHINTNDLRGGAARIPYRLMNEQNKMGHMANMLVGFKETTSTTTFPFDIKMGNNQELTSKGFQYYDLVGSFFLHENPLFQKADIIHLHNLHGGYFHPFSLSFLSHLKPIVWSLHDMHSVTGHCGYSYECNRWQTGCGDCPLLREYPKLDYDRTSKNLEEKKLVYDHSKLFIVPTAKWIGDIAQKGILQGHPMEVVLNGVDIETYRPMNKDAVREKYGIPKNRIIIGAVANGGTFGQERKGGKYVQAVVDRLVEAGYDVLLVNVGGSTKGYEHEHLYHVGYIATEEEMAEVYNTFDLYLFPSLADTCPLVISEAMACGVPVVTFDTGGIPELVQHGETGFVASQKNVDQLFAYTEKLVTDVGLRERFSKASRPYGVAHFNHRLVTNHYLDVYEEAIRHFNESKNKILYFDLERVPDVVKNQRESQQAEQIKGKEISKQLTKKPLVAIVTEGTEDLSEVDAVFVKRDQFTIEEGYFDTMLYKGIETDVVAGDIVLKRMNNKDFFKKATPVVAAEKSIDTSFGSLLYSKNFFTQHRQAILSGEMVKYQSIESFSVENSSITINDYMKLKVNGPVYIYGGGTHTIELLNESKYLCNMVLRIIDRNPALIGTNLLERFEIVALESIREDVPILISSASFEEEIYGQLSNTVKNQLIKIYNC